MKAYMSAVSSICRKTGRKKEEEVSRCTCISHFGQNLITYVTPKLTASHNTIQRGRRVLKGIL